MNFNNSILFYTNIIMFQFQQKQVNIKKFSAIQGIKDLPEILNIRQNLPYWNFSRKQRQSITQQLSQHKKMYVEWSKCLKSQSLKDVQQLNIYCMWQLNDPQLSPFIAAFNGMQKLRKLTITTTQKIVDVPFKGILWGSYIRSGIKFSYKQQDWRTQEQKVAISNNFKQTLKKEENKNKIGIVFEGYSDKWYRVVNNNIKGYQLQQLIQNTMIQQKIPIMLSSKKSQILQGNLLQSLIQNQKFIVMKIYKLLPVD